MINLYSENIIYIKTKNLNKKKQLKLCSKIQTCINKNILWYDFLKIYWKTFRVLLSISKHLYIFT